MLKGLVFSECDLYNRFMLFYFPDQKLSLVLEDITLSVDVQDVYSKFKMNLGAANIDHFIRER